MEVAADVRVLILCLNYAPELIGVGKYTAEFASWLNERGHEVRVVAAPPYYPEWRLRPGHARWRWRRETVGGIEVLRCPLWVPAAPTACKRILHLLSFALSSLLPTLWQALSWRPQVVWTVEPTAFAAPGALLAARLVGARACLHVQDLEIEAAGALRMIATARLYRAARLAYGWLLRRFDLVSTIGEQMRRELRTHGIAEERLCLFPNWVDTEAIQPLAAPSRLRDELGIGAAQVVVLYAGNLGRKQGIGTLGGLAERLAAHPEIRLVMCGAGALRARLERRVAGRRNVTLLPLQPCGRFNELLNLADIHILPQRAQAGSFALPSKLGGMLASGRPVVVQASGGELARAARVGGIAVPPDDPAAMVGAILQLAADPERRRRLGLAGRQFALANLARELVLTRYESRLAGLCRAASRRWRPRLRDVAAGGLAEAPAVTCPAPPLAPSPRR